MSSKYPKSKVRPDKTSFTSLWKYAGACANPNGHLLISHLPNEETKAVFGLDSLEKNHMVISAPHIQSRINL